MRTNNSFKKVPLELFDIVIGHLDLPGVAALKSTELATRGRINDSVRSNKLAAHALAVLSNKHGKAPWPFT